MKRILVIGATSAIAEAYARIEAARGSQLLLAARNLPRLQAIAADLRVRGAADVSVLEFDVDAIDAQPSLLAPLFQTDQALDVVLIAHGTLPDQARCNTDAAYAMAQFHTNGTATIALMNATARLLEAQGRGTLAVISSVAGDRGRASNALYGSAKAAVSAFASGLRQRFAKTDVNVLTIKPGFVDTPMTAAFRKGPLWAKPDQVAKGIARAIDRGASVTYLPWFWWGVMRVITHLPEAVFRRIKL